jgi:transaldolase
MPEATLAAFRDHGRVRPEAVVENSTATAAVLSRLAKAGIDLDGVAAQLLDDGLAAFEADLAKVLAVIEAKLEDAPSTV